MAAVQTQGGRFGKPKGIDGERFIIATGEMAATEGGGKVGTGRWGREGGEQEGKSVTLSPTLSEPAGKMCPSGLPFLFLSFLYDLNTLKYNTSS